MIFPHDPSWQYRKWGLTGLGEAAGLLERAVRQSNPEYQRNQISSAASELRHAVKYLEHADRGLANRANRLSVMLKKQVDAIDRGRGLNEAVLRRSATLAKRMYLTFKADTRRKLPGKGVSPGQAKRNKYIRTALRWLAAGQDDIAGARKRMHRQQPGSDHEMRTASNSLDIARDNLRLAKEVHLAGVIEKFQVMLNRMANEFFDPEDMAKVKRFRPRLEKMERALRNIERRLR